MPLPVVPVARLVHDHGARKDEHVVLPLRDLHAVRVGQREPPLRHRGDLASAAGEDVLVIEEVALRLQIVGPGTSTVNR